MIALLVSAIVAQAAYVPPVERDSATSAQAWLVEDQKRGLWCAFKSRTAMARYAKTIDIDALASGRGNGYGWIRMEAHVLQSITIVNESEDAVAEDRYWFDRNRKAIGLKRTGHYINAPLATFTYLPDGVGRLRLDAASKRIVSRLNADQQETYITDWPTIRRIEDLPFHRLIDFSGSRVSVKVGCSPIRATRSRG